MPLIHHRPKPHVEAHITSLPETERPRLKALSNTEPAGLLQVSADVHPDYAEGSELTSLHGVAVSEGTPVPEDLDAIEVPPGAGAVFATPDRTHRPLIHMGGDGL